ncbi:hypothetical protein SAMN05421821_118111 [Mucilaginibacter lappiensis]|uniref:Cytochrome C oxidase subunit IV n=1 Tax=Mucilaginibacter lappiensis TaxID=354630 RepID=A0ABR6PRK0_9SPHI|nr:hypothetical protein [Mucilaginibacter lappiensis]MBB6112359.1 hypothetical protein [Mucilaginibacter lappiensis]SIS01414.1 hypothetical protein SAMN05421821_118111 [Mucilaginibacter lappiensis]
MKRLGIHTFQFYRLLLLYNIAFTVLALFLLIFNAGSINAGTVVVLLISAKIIGFISALALHYFSAKENYFYFRNAGYGIKRMFISTFAIDLSICVLLIILSKIILHAATYFKG